MTKNIYKLIVALVMSSFTHIQQLSLIAINMHVLRWAEQMQGKKGREQRSGAGGNHFD